MTKEEAKKIIGQVKKLRFKCILPDEAIQALLLLYDKHKDGSRVSSGVQCY